jgi:uncharacterized protein YuzE
MSITIAGTTFDDYEYDSHGDVLYLSVGPPTKPARTLSTPEGHAVDYDERGEIIGMVLISVRRILEREGTVTVTVPPSRVSADDFGDALAA